MARVIAFGVDELQRMACQLQGGLLPRGRGCDFCATESPAYRYPARDCGLGTIIYGPSAYRPFSLGYWGACTACSDLVESGDWPALARRSLRSLNLDFSQAGPGMRVRMLAQVRSAHEAFRRARLGPREAYAA